MKYFLKYAKQLYNVINIISSMVEWTVAVALGASGLTFVLWVITTYLTFLKNRPRLSVKVPRYVEKNDEWHIYVYNEGNRATRMLEQYIILYTKIGRLRAKNIR